MSLFEIKRSQALKNLFITILFYFSKFKIEKTMERNSKKIKNTIKSIIKDSTIHGIPRLLKANSLMSKISWILLFICSISYCIYLIITASLSYLQYNTVTNFEIIPEIQADFPVVTICNLNQLQKNNSFYLVQKYSQMSYFSNLI